jgi:tetratricopeptide (TPR) repeat protein
VPKLRLTQSTVSQDRYRVESSLVGDGLSPQTATSEFDFLVTPQDREDLRWYLEDYLQNIADPAPKIAARIEGRIAEMGASLFNALFQASDDARHLWATLSDRLNDTRVEIITGVQEGTALPWELLRDPKTDTPLALRADAFVRASHPAGQCAYPSEASTGPIRILLAICRPGGSNDVPFRSVAIRLIKGLSQSAREAFQLDVLRPPTFAQLGKVLRAAKTARQSYHVVHFDGHGTYEDLNAHFSGQPPKNPRGYLAFENPQFRGKSELVHGALIGKMLAETGVPMLVLNACRSAHAEVPARSVTVPDLAAPPNAESHILPNQDVYAQAQAFGSLAQEVVDAGVAGVVAMRYNVYVATAAQFVAELYGALAGGQALAKAVMLGRKQLEERPLREITDPPRPLQDWMVPIVYEAAPVVLFPKQAQKAEQKAELKITVNAGIGTQTSQGLTSDLEKRPDTGFLGRDETLLALDRAFDTQAIALLHAYAGSGKTSTGVEFARWYHLTGGIDGPVLFTSFEHYKSLAQVLNETMGRVFDTMLEQFGIHWLTLSDNHRRDVALQVMQQIPVLWIWDNVESIAGFPTGTQSEWSGAEQQALADFLRVAKHTKAKFLLTSRRDERGWLEDLPARIPIPPMPMQERVLLARAIAEKHGRRLTDLEDWMPLLRFTGGNPLIITVLLGQALRDGLTTKAQVEAFVTRLRAGEAAFEDEASQGRDKSLGASLSYGFEHAFSEVERKQLALLHLFQGFVDEAVLVFMGVPEKDWCLPEVRGLTKQASRALLDRAAEVGLLNAHHTGYYTIHPALPWFFKGLFEQYYLPLRPVGKAAGLKATRAFVEAIGQMGSYYSHLYEEGNRDVIAMLTAEEANLLFARELALKHGWWDLVTKTMQGLNRLYGQTGRHAEWASLVNQLVPSIVDRATDEPIPGRDPQAQLAEWRVHLAQQARQWVKAEHLQRASVNRARELAAAILAMPPEAWDGGQQQIIRSLAATLQLLGDIQREIGRPNCVISYEESQSLCERIGDRAGAAVCAFNLGHVYLTLPDLRDLEHAERWYRRSLEMRLIEQRHDRAHCLGQLGMVAHERFREARAAKGPEAELLGHLNAAVRSYQQALNLLPQNAVDDRAIAHTALGVIYGDAGDFDRALSNYREAIRYYEAAGSVYGAAEARLNAAKDLARSDQPVDALEYALAALRSFETFGDRAIDGIQETEQLVAKIERALKTQGD